MRKLNRRRLLAGTAIAAGAGVVAWSMKSPADVSNVAPVESSPTPPQVIGVVSEKGFNLSLGAVRVSASAGVAAPGTQIAVTLPNEPPPADFSAFSRSVGQPVDIVLGDGEQPKKPVTIVFDLRGTALAANVSDASPLAVISWSGAPDSWEIMAGTWDAEAQTLSIESNHLTGFWTFLLDIGKFVAETVSGLLGVSFPKPACAYQPLTIGATPYNIAHTGGDPIWPCLSTANGDLLVDLHSNSNMSWAVATNPSVTGSVSGAFKDLGPGLAAIYQGLAHLLGNERSAVMPGGTVRIRFDPTIRSIRVEAKQAPALFVVATTLQVVISVLEALPTGKVAEFVLASFSTYDCFSEVINTFYQDDSSEIARSIVISTLNCLPGLIDAAAKDAAKNVPQLIVSTAAAIVGMLIAGANAIWGDLQGIYRELTGSGTVSFTITGGTVQKSSAPSQTATAHGPSLDAPIVVKWRFEEGGPIYAPPVIANGTVYLGKRGEYLCALDAATGREHWHAGLTYDIPSTPVIAGGLIFVTSDQRSGSGLQAFDARSGNERWHFGGGDAAVGPPVGPPAVANSVVYVGASGSFYALDAATGKERWQIRQSVSGSPIVARGVVYVDGNDGYLLALDAASGSERWRFFVGEKITTPAVAHGTVYVGTGAGQFHAIDAQTGKERWRFSSENWIASTPTVSGGLVYIDGQSRFHALSTDTGAEQWSFSTQTDRLFSSSAVASGIVYLAGDHLYALDAATGKEYWRFALDNFVTQPRVATGEGIVCVSNKETNLVAFGNLLPMRLRQETLIRGAPSQTGVERGKGSVGDSVTYRGSQELRNGITWLEVSVGSITGWIPIGALDPATAPPDGAIEYVYIPD